jgi:acetyl esterase/lipase
VATPFPRTVIFKTVGGHQIALDLYRPASEVPVPVVVWIHGGALIMGSRAAIHGRSGLLDACLGRGMAVVTIDYRLAPETKLPAILADVKDAFAWVGEAGSTHGLDPRRVGVMGHSAGGYLALMCGFMIEPRPRALVAYYGYGDIAGSWYARPDPFYNREPAVSDEAAWGAVGSTPLSAPDEAKGARRFEFYLWTRQRGLWPNQVAGKDPLTQGPAFDAWCPVRNVDASWPPTLLLHGTADSDVPYEQSVQMRDAVIGAGAACELITIEDGPHSFERGVTLADLTMSATPVGKACADSVAFLARALAADA